MPRRHVSPTGMRAATLTISSRVSFEPKSTPSGTTNCMFRQCWVMHTHDLLYEPPFLMNVYFLREAELIMGWVDSLPQGPRERSPDSLGLATVLCGMG